MESAEVTQTPEQQEKKPIDKEKLFNDIVEILETMLITVFVVLMLFTYLIRPVTVEGRSMVPTLQDKDRLVMQRLFYTPHQGDVVVVGDYNGYILDESGNAIDSGSALNEVLIKRVIAVAGQSIDVRPEEGKVYVDGQALEENYINEPTMILGDAFSYPITIPEGYIFVMGDNRNHSTDSRFCQVGLVPEDAVIGHAFFRYASIDTEFDSEGKEEEQTRFDTIGFIK